MTKKTTKKALLMSALSLLLCFSMLIGTTFAWFTDEVQSAKNTIIAGNLDIEVYYAYPSDVVDGDIPAGSWKKMNADSPIFNEKALWEPGYTEAVFLKFVNEGTLALQYQLQVDILKEVFGKTKDGKDIQLSNFINAYICNSFEWNYKDFLFADRENAQAPAGAPTPYYTSLYEAANGSVATPNGDNALSLDSWQWLEPEEATYATMVLWMPETVGNEANHDGINVPSIDLGVKVVATQYNWTAEKDSFDNNYDEDAWHPEMKVATADGLQAALNNAQAGSVITFEGDIDANQPIVISAPETSTFARNAQAVTIDLNGNTLNGNFIVEAGATAVITNGTINGSNVDYSAIESKGNLTLDNLTITTLRHAVRVEGGMTVINSGSYTAGGYQGRTQYAVNVSNGGNVVIYGGTFVGPKGTVSDSGAAVNVQANSTGTIYGGSFSGGKTKTLSAKGTLTVYSGSFDQDPTAYAAEGLTAVQQNGSYYLTGVEGELYISNVKELIAFAESVNAGNSYNNQTVALIADIDLNGATWTPIGISSGKGFNGTFDGNGHTVSNFKLSTSSGNYGAGFFGNLLGGSVIKNVNFDSVSYSTRANIVGVVAGYLYGSGTFENVHVTNANVQAFGKVAGILGMAADPGAHTITMTNCSVEGIIGGGYNVGGLIGLVLKGQTVNLTNCETDVVFYMNDGGYNYSYVETDAGCMWNYNDQPNYAGVAELYCYRDAQENENCMGKANELYFVATDVASLQALANSTGKNVNILFANDITGDVTVTQKPDVKVSIDGNNYKFNGVITVDGKSARYETAAMTIKNIAFEAETLSADAFIRLGYVDAARYTNNVTVEGCTFTGNGFVAVKSYTGGDWNLTLKDCVVNKGMHSFLQVANVEQGLKITNCKVYSKNGINLNNTPSLEMTGCTFDVTGYAVRFGVAGTTVKGEFTIEGCTLKSACNDGDAIIIFRGTVDGTTLTLKENTFEGTSQMMGHEKVTIK